MLPSAAARRRRRIRTLVAVIVPTALAVATGLGLYLLAMVLGLFASAPASDAQFGNLNRCLLQALPGFRSGFSIAHKGRALAGYSGSRVAVCFPSMDAFLLEAPAGVRAISFDAKKNVWIATESSGEGMAQLWQWRSGEMEKWIPYFGVAPLAMVALENGVLTLDARGQLVFVSGDGEQIEHANLGMRPEGWALMATSGDGAFASIVTSGALWLVKASPLRIVYAQSPCSAEFAWWLENPSRVLLACAPESSWALTVEPNTEKTEVWDEKLPSPSLLVPGLGSYVESCEGLPCGSRAP